ncbi:MAG: flagellar hook-basal body complex protein FliE [Kiloniellales bacterium]|nr:flagellar hook-basal body complex protein FliE [Kiloniellales bacterium]
MAVDFNQALAAYDRALRGEGLGGLESRDQGSAGGSDFSEALREATESAIDVLHKGEMESFRAAAGQADITEVVTAVSQAEITLQTMVAVRDRVIQAYQEILRMPI